MEDLPGNLEKALTDSRVPKPSKRKVRWTLLFVGDHGRTVPVRMYKGIFLLFLFTLISSLAAAGVFFLLYRNVGEENRRLVGEINGFREQIVTLKFDKDVIMTRLVVAETKGGKEAAPVKTPLPAETHRSPERPSPAATPAAAKPRAPEKPATPEPGSAERPRETEKVPAPKASPAPVSPTPAPGPESGETTEREPESVPGSEPVAPPQLVTIENLEVSHDPGSDLLGVTFLLRKVDSEIEIVSGHAFVILIPAAEDGRSPGITLPAVSLVDGKPSPINRGQYFSISRFKPMKFEKAKITRPENFSMVRLVVFDTRGNLLLEQDYPMNIREMSAD